jgi:hypothetical protein
VVEKQPKITFMTKPRNTAIAMLPPRWSLTKTLHADIKLFNHAEEERRLQPTWR